MTKVILAMMGLPILLVISLFRRWVANHGESALGVRNRRGMRSLP